jgi:hypothetical protein
MERVQTVLLIANQDSEASATTVTVSQTATVTTTISTAVSGSPSSSSSSPPSSTIASILSVPTTGTLALNCPGLNGNTMTATPRGVHTYSFEVMCGGDYGSGGGQLPDIVGIISYSIEHCIDACAGYNLNLGSTGCVGVVFNSNLTGWQTNWGTCFLKNTTAFPGGNGGNAYAAAKLIT